MFISSFLKIIINLYNIRTDKIVENSWCSTIDYYYFPSPIVDLEIIYSNWHLLIVTSSDKKKRRLIGNQQNSQFNCCGAQKKKDCKVTTSYLIRFHDMEPFAMSIFLFVSSSFIFHWVYCLSKNFLSFVVHYHPKFYSFPSLIAHDFFNYTPNSIYKLAEINVCAVAKVCSPWHLATVDNHRLWSEKRCQKEIKFNLRVVIKHSRHLFPGVVIRKRSPSKTSPLLPPFWHELIAVVVYYRNRHIWDSCSI